MTPPAKVETTTKSTSLEQGVLYAYKLDCGCRVTVSSEDARKPGFLKTLAALLEGHTCGVGHALDVIRRL